MVIKNEIKNRQIKIIIKGKKRCEKRMNKISYYTFHDSLSKYINTPYLIEHTDNIILFLEMLSIHKNTFSYLT